SKFYVDGILIKAVVFADDGVKFVTGKVWLGWGGEYLIVVFMIKGNGQNWKEICRVGFVKIKRRVG
uniref:hypothetical protein n=1 Tax=Bacillus pumilus TaxID=1408 RepID=UPI001C9305DD